MRHEIEQDGTKKKLHGMDDDDTLRKGPYFILSAR